MMSIKIVEEYALNACERFAIQSLLAESFPEEPSLSQRIYYKQLPQRRVLMDIDGSVVGQCGIEHRIIGTSTGPSSILGVIDLCVLEQYRHQGSASKLLQWTESHAVRHGIDFIVLFASDSRLYETLGYKNQSNSLRWMMIDEHETLGIAEEPVIELMIKEVGDKSWPQGLVDMLGYLF
jgi:predicted N-acetyltransferase YhbS